MGPGENAGDMARWDRFFRAKTLARFWLSSLVVIVALVLGREHVVDTRAAAGVVSILMALNVAAQLLLFTAPRPRAERDGAELVLAVARWRRVVLALLAPVIGGIVLVTFPILEASGRWIAGTVLAACTACAIWFPALRLRLTAEGFVRERWGRRAELQRWSSVRRAVVHPIDGVTVRVVGGGWSRLHRLMDGYPEGAAYLLERLPVEALSWHPGARALLEHHAACGAERLSPQ
ncbi:MAG TPA: hypothetical protein VEB43_16875 [Anaeromyxobacter sp.]|nr:hypothetical protein [Anaeromyxobacter sp.]